MEQEQEQQIQPFGYAEMFEWKSLQDQLNNNGTGLFVQFSKSEPDKIEPFHDAERTIGVTSSNFAVVSDNPIEWPGMYETCETGEYIREKKYIAVGNKVYDQQQEINIVRTFPYTVYKKKVTDEYDKSRQQYIQRAVRPEWTAVTFKGKARVYDDGTCVPGGYCKPGKFEDLTKAGYATKSDGGYYVIKRISDNVILILL